MTTPEEEAARHVPERAIVTFGDPWAYYFVDGIDTGRTARRIQGYPADHVIIDDPTWDAILEAQREQLARWIDEFLTMYPDAEIVWTPYPFEHDGWPNNPPNPPQ